MRFLKLTGILINASKIVSIEQSGGNSFRIIFGHSEPSGTLFAASGWLSSELCEYKVTDRDADVVREFFDGIPMGFSADPVSRVHRGRRRSVKK